MGIKLSSMNKLFLKSKTEIVIWKAWIMIFSKKFWIIPSWQKKLSIWSMEHLPKLNKVQRRTKVGVKCTEESAKKRHRFKSRTMNYERRPLRLSYYNIYKGVWFPFSLKWMDITKNLEEERSYFSKGTVRCCFETLEPHALLLLERAAEEL